MQSSHHSDHEPPIRSSSVADQNEKLEFVEVEAYQQPREVGPNQPTAIEMPSRPRHSTSMALLSRVFLLLALLLVLQYVVPYTLEKCQYAITRGRQRAQYDLSRVELNNVGLNDLSQAFQLISRRVSPSVVHIDVTSVDAGSTPEEFVRRFGPHYRESHGQGSGVIVDEAGFIITNHHVVYGAKEIQVSLSDGRRFAAAVIGHDQATDLAVLQIRGDKLIAAEWGDSEELDEGAMVWAVGSPFGLKKTITFGIVSAKHRSGMAGDVYQDFLQTDAAVNPGNSGGPLVDARGRIVGINTAILGESYRGVSFAIPSSIARDIYQKIRADGAVARGWLGVRPVAITDEIATRMGLETTKGALIAQVIDDPTVATPAYDAGMLSGDVVVAWNGNPVHTPAELIRAVAMTAIGTKAEVVVIREKQEKTLLVRVAQRPPTLDE